MKPNILGGITLDEANEISTAQAALFAVREFGIVKNMLSTLAFGENNKLTVDLYPDDTSVTMDVIRQVSTGELNLPASPPYKESCQENARTMMITYKAIGKSPIVE